MFAASRREPLNSATLIIPVPLHAKRERERGFNQAAVLARALGRVSNLPVDEYSLIRRIHTARHRAGMDEDARRESVAGAFTVRHGDVVKDASVLLIDDVFTTGATVSAAAAVLKEEGAAAVFVLTLARSQALL
jgi:ComF family protein